MSKPSRWQTLPADAKRGSQQYRAERDKWRATIKATQQLVTTFVTGGNYARTCKLQGCSPGTIGSLSWSIHHA